MQNTAALQILDAIQDQLDQLRQQLGGGEGTTDADLPTAEERQTYARDRQEAALQYWRTHGTHPTPEHDIGPLELNRAAKVSASRNIHFNDALRMVRGAK